MAAYEYISLNGTVVADTSDTKTEVRDEYKAVFGDDIDLADETPEGVLVNGETISRNGVAVNNANLANQINPNFAGGIFLDAIMSLTAALIGGRRFAESSTFSQPVDLTGVPFTLIVEGSIALTTDNDQFKSLADVTLDSSGLGSVAFQSVEKGPIPAAIGDLNAIAAGAALGWETVSNPVAATLGRTDESDSALRLRRNDTLALQGISISIAITSALNNIDGVKSISFRENFEGFDQVIDGIFLLKNSVWACVDGGADTDIGEALLENKSGGSGWNGAVTIPTTDPASGQVYQVSFDRPVEVQAWVRVTIAPTTVSSPGTVIETSVLRYANGLIDGELGFVVGASVSPFEISAAVNFDTPTLFVKLVELSDDGISYSVAELAVDISEVARTSAGQISTVIV